MEVQLAHISKHLVQLKLKLLHLLVTLVKALLKLLHLLVSCIGLNARLRFVSPRFRLLVLLVVLVG